MFFIDFILNNLIDLIDFLLKFYLINCFYDLFLYLFFVKFCLFINY